MNKVHLVFGPQGSGKSTYSKKLAEQVNGVHMSIDEWMWGLYGMDLPKPMNLNWIMERVKRCEKRIWEMTKQISICGGNVVLDLGFMKVKNRELFLTLAEEQNILTQLHYIDASLSIRRKRVLERNNEKGETFSFEVTPVMFDFMENEFEKPTKIELKKSLLIDTTSI